MTFRGISREFNVNNLQVDGEQHIGGGILFEEEFIEPPIQTSNTLIGTSNTGVLYLKKNTRHLKFEQMNLIVII